MNKKTISHFICVLLLALCCIFLCGCVKADDDDPPAYSSTSSFQNTSSAQEQVSVRDNTPKVLIPSADGTVIYGTDTINVDASHTDQGYIMVQYLGSNPKVKLQIDTPDDNTYTYLLSQEQEYETFPLPAGDGGYSLTILENVEDSMYSIAFSQDISVTISDEFLPFLYPNQYVFFTPDSQAIAKGKDLAQNALSDLETVERIYHYIIQNISYDTEKATNVSYGYLPDIDDTLLTGKGICFDYASLMSAMLRSQNIPTRLEVGYADEAYHAWISVYVDDIGWIDGIIQFDGNSWSLMDPTYASSASSSELKKFIGAGNYYIVKYLY